MCLRYGIRLAKVFIVVRKELSYCEMEKVFLLATLHENAHRTNDPDTALLNKSAKTSISHCC